MESNDTPLPRNMYHTLYLATQQSEPTAAIQEMYDRLIKSGYTDDFIQEMQFAVLPKSIVTGHYGVMAMYWSI